MKLNQLPLMLISRAGATCTWDQNWSGPASEEGLVNPTKLLADCATPLPKKVAVILEDELLTPQKIEKDSSINAKELEPWLLYKMRRFLRIPQDQAQIQFISLPNHWLTFALPKSWINQLVQWLEDHQSHCGIIGGFSDLVAQRASTLTMALFDDYWLQFTTGKNLEIQNYQFRRLPLLPNGSLDLDTFAKVDAAQAGQNQADAKAELWFFSDRWDSVKSEVVNHLSPCFNHLQAQASVGSMIDRLNQAREPL